ncbi:hypothetical protein N7494_008406 [Penicillium frequentans]|uniref:AMP-binding enzyme C-terminal domain-containing protein n=1 Tax=Penicillium frequentans TaxID=3151616 RepID=A0AAD6CVZ6_9EURO|nr:hypothetical protein N7494_008406 [Penicillium glabrum]
MMLRGAPVTLDVVKCIRDLGATSIMVGYGMRGIAVLNTSIDTTSLELIKSDISVGTIFAGGLLRICALGSRTPIHKKEIGEVHLGGCPVFGGYLGSSRNQGYMNGEGYLISSAGIRIYLIIRGGDNISPLKIEQCLGEVLGIKDARVVGIPDTTAGEVPVAVIRKDPLTQAPKPQAIQMMILNKFGASFAPARVFDLQDDLRKDTYPTTTSGKIQKAILREWIMDHLSHVTAKNRESPNDLTSEVTRTWSGITGLTLGDIDPGVPIRTFADSIMQIQCCHLIGQRLQLRHALLRSTPIAYDDELDLYLVMHPSADWMRLQVIDGGTVEDVNCVATYKRNDPEYDHIDKDRPLFRAIILSVNNSSVVALVMHLHHLIMDAHIFSRWLEDLRLILNHEQELLDFCTYRDYITDYHRYRIGVASQKTVDFHVNRIRGVSSAKDALWPPQIAPHWLKSDSQGWVRSYNTPGSPSERPLRDDDKCCGTKGISRAVLVPKILELQHRFAITSPIIAKCACALLNV